MRKLIILIFCLIILIDVIKAQTDSSINKIDQATNLSILFGIHSFHPTNPNDPFLYQFAFQEMVGIELSLSKINTTFDLRRYYWINISGGGWVSILNAYSMYDHIGLKYSLKIKNNIGKAGLSHSWLVDHSLSTDYYDYKRGKIMFYSVRSISPYISWNYRKCDIELRYYYYYFYNKMIPKENLSKLPNVYLGIVYRFCPKGYR